MDENQTFDKSNSTDLANLIRRLFANSERYRALDLGYDDGQEFFRIAMLPVTGPGGLGYGQDIKMGGSSGVSLIFVFDTPEDERIPKLMQYLTKDLVLEPTTDKPEKGLENAVRIHATLYTDENELPIICEQLFSKVYELENDVPIDYRLIQAAPTVKYPAI